MSIRRKTDRRLTLIRPCGTCGQLVVTTAASPFMRMIERDGKKEATTYYCCESCYKTSYKHIGWFDGKYEERKRENDKKRDIKEKNRRYYAAHAEDLRAKRRAYYAANPGLAAENSRFQREKIKLKQAEKLE